MSPGREIAIRDATIADVDAIAEIERTTFSDPWSPRSFRELVGRPDVVFVVAVTAAGADAAEGADAAAGADAVVVGYATVYLAGSDGDLANLATAAGARRKGTGRRLLRHVLDTARARGTYLVFLEVRESNLAARALYESEGFTGVGRRARYYAHPVEDALILRKELV